MVCGVGWGEGGGGVENGGCPLALPPCARARAAMALSALSGDEQGVLFVQLCDVLDPGIAVA